MLAELFLLNSNLRLKHKFGTGEERVPGVRGVGWTDWILRTPRELEAQSDIEIVVKEDIANEAERDRRTVVAAQV